MRDETTAVTGGPAPEASFEGGAGEVVRLSALWKEAPLVLVFLRHLGWIFCRDQLAQLRRSWPEFEERRARLVAVSPAAGEPTKSVCGMLNLPFTCLGDPSGEAYDSFGLARGRMGQMFNLRTFTRAFLAFLRGKFQGRPVGDRFRLPGAFVIDREGLIRWAWRGRDAADHANAVDLLAALDALKSA